MKARIIGGAAYGVAKLEEGFVVVSQCPECDHYFRDQGPWTVQLGDTMVLQFTCNTPDCGAQWKVGVGFELKARLVLP